MKNKLKICLIIIFVIFIFSLLVTKVYAYFQTHTATDGTVQMEFGQTSTYMYQEVSSNGVDIYIANTGDYHCYVRVKIFASTSANISYEAESGWNQQGDGYWYYDPILAPGTNTNKIVLKNPTENVENAEKIQIIAIQEITEVMYNENGEPYADWNKSIK